MKNNYMKMAALAALIASSPMHAQNKPASPSSKAPAFRPCSSVTVDAPTSVILGKSSVLKLSTPVTRMVVGGMGSSRAARPTEGNAPAGAPMMPPQQGTSDGVADVDITLLSPTELFVLGKKSGSMNLVLQGNDGRCLLKDIVVTIDPAILQAKIAEVMPEETGIKVRGAENAIVLTGKVSDALKLDDIMTLASSYGDGKKVVNLLRVSTPQQVMLEVKIAEVSKNILDHFGLDYARAYTSADGLTSRILSGIIGGGPAVFGQFSPGGTINGSAAAVVNGGSTAGAAATLNTSSRSASLFGLDAQKQDGLIRVLAEPNIMAISGQSASFLSGGKIFIPVAQSGGGNGGGTVITLEEKEFGVGLKFTPTVLDGTRINLKLVSEASELSQTGSPFTTINGVTSVLPSIATRRVDTTVQLNDGQSFAIAGLVKNNVTETLKKFPGVGEIPVVGTLFSSSEFQKAQTELLFVITPHLVKPVNGPITLPTDNHVEASRNEVMFIGKQEGIAPPPAPAAASAPPATPSPVPAPASAPSPATK